MNIGAVFFVPAATRNEAEKIYGQLATFAGSVPASPERRIQSVTWRHNGEVWTATVGESLRGVATRTVGRGRQAREFDDQKSDSAMVLAIFDGVPLRIVTDARPITGKISGWNNPIYAGGIQRISYFAPLAD